MRRKKAFRFISRNIELFTLSLPAVIYIFIMAYIPMFGVMIAFKKNNLNELNQLLQEGWKVVSQSAGGSLPCYIH